MRIITSLFLLLVCMYGNAQTQINGRVITPTVYFIEGSGAPSGNCSASFNYGVVYFDHTGFNLYFCANGGWVQGSTTTTPPSGTGNQVYATPNGSTGAATLRSLVPADLPVTAPVAQLPGTPFHVFSFVAPGDQTGLIVHDISGNGHNATISSTCTPGNCWTGTGFTFANQTTGSAVTTVMAAATNQVHCATLYIPFYGTVGSNNTPNQLILSTGGGHGWTATETGAQAYGTQVFQDVINNGGGTTLDALPVESGFHTRCIEFRSGQTNRIFIDGIETGYASTSTDVFSGTWQFAFVLSNNFSGIFYYYAAWNSVITDAQILQASLAMNAAVAARGVQTTPVNLLTGKTTLHAQGDSITCCGGTGSTWYPALISVSAVYGTPVNEGYPGAPVLTFAEAAKWRDTPTCNSGNQPSLVTIFGGTNDGLFGATAQTTYNYIMYDVSVLRAAGCQVGVATMLSRTAEDTFKNQLNPLIRAGSAIGGYFVIDTAAVPLLGADGAFSGGDFSGDNVHPNQTGQNAIGAVFSNAINAYGIGSASLANPSVYSSNAVTMASADRFATIIPTAAATATLPDCLGVTGAVYQIFNASAGANTITFSGLASEAITGSATLAQNVAGRFQATLISQTAGGCGWQRIQ